MSRGLIFAGLGLVAIAVILFVGDWLLGRYERADDHLLDDEYEDGYWYQPHPDEHEGPDYPDPMWHHKQ